MNNSRRMGPAGILIVCLCATFCCATVAFGQGVRSSAHDFSSYSWTPEGDLCTPCHTVYAEWNHKMSTQTYTISDSPTLDAADFGQPDGTSARCLGCHDGTVPIDAFGDRTGSTYIAPSAQLGPDLRTHHPVSFTYDAALATKDGGLHDPTTTESGLGGTIAARLLSQDGKLQCTACHEAHLNTTNDYGLVKPAAGGTLCKTCHKIGDGPPNDHTETRKGFADHKPGLGNPIENGCALCHGPNLNDGFAVSCYTCHDNYWAGEGPPADHTETRMGFADHRPGLGNPIENGCTQCHGENLDDGFAPSCYTCHDNYWAGEGPPADHTETRMGFADHRPGLGNPIENGCTQCHGENLDDGFAPSCYTCHDHYWAGEGPPADHTETRMGFADHRPGLGNPIDNDCGQCHGENLDDGFATSCYTCHDRIWAGEGPPEDHTDVRRGIAAHQPGLETPIDSGCTQCHGPNLHEGFAPSCFTCHVSLWGGGENLPPSVDTGGPYTGSAGYAVALNASGTTDPDGDTLTFTWDFGDGSTVESSGTNPAIAHVYDTTGTYTGTLTVADGVNTPVSVNFQVTVTDDPPGPQDDVWDVSVLLNEYTVSFTEDGDILAVETTDAGGGVTVGVGIELNGVIFWMNMPGSVFFGNIDRTAGTMFGVMLGDGSGSSVFTGTQQ